MPEICDREVEMLAIEMKGFSNGSSFQWFGLIVKREKITPFNFK